MSPISFGLPLLSPALQGASRAVGEGIDFLQTLWTAPPPSTPAAPPAPSPRLSLNPAVADLQRMIAGELGSAGFGDALPLEIADDGFGDIRVLSDHPDRRAIEQLLNSHPIIAGRFRALAGHQAPLTTLRLAIPAPSSFDTRA